MKNQNDNRFPRSVRDSDEYDVATQTELQGYLDAAATADNSIKLNITQTIELDSELTVPADAMVTLAGNGVDEEGLPFALDAGAKGFRVLTNNGTLVINNLRLVGGRAVDLSDISGDNVNGGGILNYADLFLREGAVVSGCEAYNWGGGVYNAYGGAISTTLVLDGGEISNNSAYGGGGVYNDAGTVRLANNGVISGNTSEINGAGVYNSNATGSVFTMEGGSVTGNISGKNGGGLYNAGNQAVITMTDGLVSGNHAAMFGGGVASKGTFTLDGGSIAENSAESAGGGVFASETFNMTKGSIENNEAPAGGGVLLMGGTATITDDAIVSGNTADAALLPPATRDGDLGFAYGSGGGIYVAENVGLALSGDALVSNNSALEGDGGGVFIDHSQLGNLTVGPYVVFSGNSAAAAYNIDEADQETYDATIQASKWTEPFTQGYNNYDISYTEGEPVSGGEGGGECEAYGNRLYVSNYDSRTISVIDEDSGDTVATIDVDYVPSYLALDAARGRLYVNTGNGVFINVIDTATNKSIKTIRFPENFTRFGRPTVDEATGKVYVSCGDGRMAVIDPDELRVERILDVATGGSGMIAVDSATNTIYYLGETELSVIDGETDEVTDTVDLSSYGTLNDVAVDSAAGQLILGASAGLIRLNLSNFEESSATEALTPSRVLVDPAGKVIALSGSTVYEIEYGDDGVIENFTGESTGFDGDSNQIASDENYVYVPTIGSGTLSRWDMDGETMDQIATADSKPSGVAVGRVCIDPPPEGGEECKNYGSLLYVSNHDSGTVSVFNMGQRSTAAAIRVGDDPTYLALDAARRLLYVDINDGSSINVINTTTNASVGTIANPLGETFGRPTVNTATGKVYVSAGDGRMAVIDPEIPGIADVLEVAPGGSGMIAVDSATNTIYYLSEEELDVIDGETNEITDTIELSGYGTLNDIAVDSANGKLLLATGGGLYTLNLPDYSLDSLLLNGQNVLSVFFDPSSGKAVSLTGTSIFAGAYQDIDSYADTGWGILPSSSRNQIAVLRDVVYAPNVDDDSITTWRPGDEPETIAAGGSAPYGAAAGEVCVDPPEGGGYEPSIIVTKAADKTTAEPGDVITYTVTFSFKGKTGKSIDPKALRFKDSLPAGLALVSGSVTIDGVPAPDNTLDNGAFWNGSDPRSLSSAYRTVTIVFQAMVNDDVQPGTLRNTATFSSWRWEGNATGALVWATTNPADVVVEGEAGGGDPAIIATKTADKTTAEPGDEIAYTLTFAAGGTPDGSDAATQISVTDYLPIGLTLVPDSVEVDGVPAYDETLYGEVIKNALAPGEAVTVTFTALVHESATGIISNTARFSYTDSDGESATINTNAADVEVTGDENGSGALTVTKTADVERANPGDLVNFTLQFLRDGAANRTPVSVTVADILPAGLTLVPGSVQVNGADTTDDTLEHAANNLIADDLPAGTPIAVTVTYTARVDDDATLDAVLRNRATFAYISARDNGALVSEVSQTNAADVVVGVEEGGGPEPSVTATKTADKETAKPGDVITYTATLTNTTELGTRAGEDTAEVIGERSSAADAEYTEFISMSIPLTTISEDSQGVIYPEDSDSEIEIVTPGIYRISYHLKYDASRTSDDYAARFRFSVTENSDGNFVFAESIYEVETDSFGDLASGEYRAIFQARLKSGDRIELTAGTLLGHKPIQRLVIEQGTSLSVELLPDTTLPGELFDIKIKDNLPEGLTLVPDSVTVDDVDAPDETLEGDVIIKEMLAPDKSVTVRFEATVDDDAAGILSNTALFDCQAYANGVSNHIRKRTNAADVEVVDDNGGGECQNPANRAYLSYGNLGSNNVPILNTDTVSVINSMSVSGEPGAQALDVERGLLYVTDTANHTIHVIQVATGETVDVIANPDDVSFGTPAVNSATGRLYVCTGDGQLLIYDPATKGTQIVALPFDGGGKIAINPDTNMVYCLGADGLAEIDGATGAVVAETDLTGNDIAVDPQYNYVFLSTDQGISVLNGGDLSLTDSVASGGAYSAMAVDTNAGLLYAINTTDSTLKTIELTQGSMVKSTDIPSGSHAQIAVDEANGKVIIPTATWGMDNSITVIDASGNVKTIYTGTLVPTGAAAGRVCLDPPLESSTATVTFLAAKNAIGAALEGGEFEFGLYDENGDLVATTTNNADGLVTFEDVQLEAPGEYDYTIKEISGPEGWEMDDTEYPVTVTVATAPPQEADVCRHAHVRPNTPPPTAQETIYDPYALGWVLKNVENEQELIAALSDAVETSDNIMIMLKDDINLTNQLYLSTQPTQGPVMTPVIIMLNGNGHTITAAKGERILYVDTQATSLTLYLSDVTLTGGNPQDGEGGGAIGSADDDTIDSTVRNPFNLTLAQGAIITKNRAVRGGGVLITNGSLFLEGGEVTENQCEEKGGGIYLGNKGGSGKFEMKSGLVSKNTSNRCSGGVYCDAPVIMSGGAISDNTAAQDSGGLETSYTLAMTGGDISGNHAGNDAGGMFLLEGGSFSGTAVIAGNTAVRDGGGVYFYNSETYPGTVEIAASAEFSGNEAANGGAVYLPRRGLEALTVDGAAFFDNKAATGYEAHPEEDDDVYAAHIFGTTWTSPYMQGYNNYDIGYDGLGEPEEQEAPGDENIVHVTYPQGSPTFKNTAESETCGLIEFPELTFDQPGDYEFYLKELTPPGDGWTTDSKTYPVIVHVVADDSGNLVATLEYPDGYPTFVNVYKTGARIVISACKIAIGAPLSDGQFNFGLFETDDGSLVTEATNGAAAETEITTRWPTVDPIGARTGNAAGVQSPCQAAAGRRLRELNARPRKHYWISGQ